MNSAIFIEDEDVVVGVEVEVWRMGIMKGLGFTKGNAIGANEISSGSLSCFQGLRSLRWVKHC